MCGKLGKDLLVASDPVLCLQLGTPVWQHIDQSTCTTPTSRHCHFMITDVKSALTPNNQYIELSILKNSLKKTMASIGICRQSSVKNRQCIHETCMMKEDAGTEETSCQGTPVIAMAMHPSDPVKSAGSPETKRYKNV